MHQLLSSIKDMPNLKLKDDQWQQITLLLSDLLLTKDLLKTPKFKASLQTLNFVDSNKLIDYLSKWLDMTEQGMLWIKEIEHVWEMYWPDKPLGNDDLLTIMTELIPSDSDNLKPMLYTIDKAIFLSHDALGFFLTNLYAAIETKLNEANAAHLAYQIEISAKAEKVILELYNQDYLQLMYHTCLMMKTYIFRELEKVLKWMGKSFQITYLTHEPDKAMLMLANDLHKKTILPKPDPDFTILLNQYLILKDMIYTITRKGANSIHKCAEFLAKLAEHKPVLESGKYPFYKQFFTDQPDFTRTENINIWLNNLKSLKMSEKFLLFSQVAPASFKQAMPLQKILDFKFKPF